ncbi:MAG TPA: amino acid adenylation domain-containing protein, partial [Thermoanaerobaculia bacterium]|nr:amino acid adenylation domain-containing protein [Thermoanaerobaculia bacterium]
FLGRFDDQVKIRGFRIEPGEVEQALAALPGVREAAVVVREDGSAGGSAGRRLIAYVAGDTTVDAVRQALRERLPDYMVPSAFVKLEALPLTPNGKVDRRSLPAPERLGAEEGYLAPRTPVEEIVAGIWSEVLGVERVGANGRFFDLGGHSLLATRVMSRLRSAFDLEMPLRDLFEAPALSDFAERVETARRAGAGWTAPPLVPVPRQGALPLSFAQRRLWFIDQLEPGSSLYNLPAALRIEGPLDPDVLAASLGEIVRRHEALRTVFASVEGSPVQVIQPAAPFAMPLVDLAGLPESRREALALALAGEEAGRPFDLTHGPLLRGALLRLSKGDHVSLLTLHHIASDGWSQAILVRELTALYAAYAEGRPSPLSELPVQYADFAAWQLSWLQGEALDNEVSYWRRQLAGLPPRLELPTDRPRPAVQSFRGASREVRLPAELTRQVHVLSRQGAATPFMVLLAGFQALLARYSGQEDFAVGTPIAGRNRLETEGLIGFFVNTLVLRGNLHGEPSFRELLGRVRDTALAAHTHQDVPFEKLVEELAPERSLAYTPLFQVMFVLQNSPGESLEIRNLHLRPVSRVGTTAKFDLTLSFAETSEGLAGALEYATDLFDRATAGRLLGHLANLLASAAADPGLPLSELRLMDVAEETLLRSGPHRTERTWAAPVAIHDLFTQQAARTPDRIAAMGTDGALSYRDIAERSAALAGRIRTVLASALDRPIALLADPDPQVLIGMIGILEAGGGFVPLDPHHPEERLAWTLRDAACEVLVTQKRHRDRAQGLGVRHILCLEDALLSAPEPARQEIPRASLAYMVYTSGSTGRPKGVQISHENLAPMLLWGCEYLGLGEHTRVLQSLSFCFDFGIFEHLTTLLAGGTLVFPGEAAGDPRAFAREIVRHGINTLHTTPAFARELAAAGVRLEGLEILHLGGEALARDTVDGLCEAAPRATVYNGYGPTEATVNSSIFRIGGPEDLIWPVVPIGRHSADNALYILDRAGRLVPFGVRGELHVGGIGVARGYLNRPDLTAERFVPDPFGPSPGGRLYRTGDLVRYLPQGDIEFLGRLDHQAKIRGFRIELGEVEAALVSVAGVREAAVVAREDIPGDRRLVAYVVGDGTIETLRQQVRERLPEYMVPAAFVPLEALPLTPNGKVDRKALPVPDRSPEPGLVAPRTPVEEILAEIWREVLGLESIGVHDSFFDRGGHSLLAVRLMAGIEKRLGRSLPLAALFAAPTLESLAAALSQEGSLPRRSPLVAVQPRGALAPFFCVHPVGGNVLCYLDLASQLAPEQPFYALQTPDPKAGDGFSGSIEAMATRYLRELHPIQPEGPYQLGGWSMGGLVAFEMARQLVKKGHQVDLVALIDTPPPAAEPGPSPALDEAELVASFARDLAHLLGREAGISPEDLRPLPAREKLDHVVRLAHATGLLPLDLGLPQIKPLYEVFAANLQASRSYTPGPYSGSLTLWFSEQTLSTFSQELLFGWNRLALGGIETSTLPGDHYSLLRQPQVKLLADQIKRRLGFSGVDSV